MVFLIKKAMQPYRILVKDLECLPENPEEFTVSINFVGGEDPQSNEPMLEISTNTLRFNTEVRDLVLTHRAIYGVMEGIPLTVVIGNTNFDFYIDLKDSLIIGQTFVECSIKKRKGKDTFMRKANATTFELLRVKGFLPDSDIFQTPYVIIKDDQGLALLFLSITTYNIVKALIEQIRSTADAASDLIKLAIPDLAGPVPVIKFSEIAKYAMKLVFEIAYTVALIIALKALIEEILEIIYPKQRYLKYMKYKQLIQAFCNFQGVTFQSSVLDYYYGLSFLPAPHETRNKNIWEYLQSSLTESFNKGYPTDQDGIKTAGEAIQFIEAVLNLKGRVINNTFYLERESFYQDQAILTIASNFNLQDKNEDQITLDLSKMFKRKAIVYARDSMETNTFDNIKGGAYEVQTDPVLVENPDLVEITGSDIIRMPCSLATRKKDLSVVEKSAQKVAQAIDSIAGSNFAAKIQNRIGIMVVSQQFFQNSKLMWIVGDRQPANYLDFIGAKPLYVNNHSMDEVKNSMFTVKSGMPIAFTGTMLENLLLNLSANYVPLETGEIAELLTLEFKPWRYEAVVDYRLPSNDGVNTKTIEVYED